MNTSTTRTHPILWSYVDADSSIHPQIRFNSERDTTNFFSFVRLDPFVTTCGITSQKREPKGYMDETILYPLIRSCIRTHHFCTKETIRPIDVPVFHDTTFIQMFSFRTYDEWARSALKPAFNRGGQRRCESVSK